jgi:hypothetical protein
MIRMAAHFQKPFSSRMAFSKITICSSLAGWRGIEIRKFLQLRSAATLASSGFSSSGLQGATHQAAKLLFERAVREFSQWRAVQRINDRRPRRGSGSRP